MARRKKEEQNPEIKNLAEQAEAAVSEKAAAPAEKPKRGRRKKADVESTAPEPAPEKKAVRKPRKKAVIPNFVIQNTADQGITYEAIVEKVKAAPAAEDVKSVDIYVKAEEGKAYYVINGEMTGAVELF